MRSVVFFCLSLILALNGKLKAQDLREEFSILLQNWQGAYHEGVFVESWKALNTDLLEGMGCYVIKGDTVSCEYLQIRPMGSYMGYLASVNNNPPVLFNLKAKGQNYWEFENKEHDFPQNIRYSLQSDGSLKIEVFGLQKGILQKDQYVLYPVKDP